MCAPKDSSCQIRKRTPFINGKNPPSDCGAENKGVEREDMWIKRGVFYMGQMNFDAIIWIGSPITVQMVTLRNEINDCRTFLS